MNIHLTARLNSPNLSCREATYWNINNNTGIQKNFVYGQDLSHPVILFLQSVTVWSDTSLNDQDHQQKLETFLSSLFLCNLCYLCYLKLSK